jgi:hypothetical protein
MSMDELLLQELYGSQQIQADEQTKQAQIELVQAVAAESGINLDELDDDELSKFAHYVLSDEDEAQYADDELQSKLAEADIVGRQMALSYADQLNQLENGEPMFDKVAYAMNDVAEAWMAEKLAAKMQFPDPDATMPQDYADLKKSLGRREKMSANANKRYYDKREAELRARRGFFGNLSKNQKIGLGIGGAALAGGLGYGAYRMMKNREKTASLLVDMISPEEFAKEAELRAAEILLANGVDPQTLEYVQPEYVKIASFPTPDEAADEDEYAVFSHYDEMLDTAAQHIIDALLS